MAWKLPNSFRRVLTRSTPHQLSFKRSKLLVNKKIFDQQNQNKRKTKTCGFCMQRIILVTSQIKGNVKDDEWCQHTVRKYHKTYIFMSPKIPFLIIYCFKVCPFFIKEAVILSQIFSPPPRGNWASKVLLWTSRFLCHWSWSCR